MGVTPRFTLARTPTASGRAVCTLLCIVAAGGCTALGAGGSRPEDVYVDPVLSPERPSRSAEVAAATLFENARQAQAVGDLDTVRRHAQEVVDRYPGAPVSGRALRLLTDVAFAQRSWHEADLLAQRWIRLVPEDDPRIAALRLIQGEARLRDGDPAGALERLAALPADEPPDVAAAALDLVRRAGAEADAAALATHVQALPSGYPLLAALLAAQARALYNAGEDEEARASAEAALSAGAQGSDAQLSRAVLASRIDESLGLIDPVTVLGVLLPRTGPPALIRFAEQVEEGVRAAAAAAGLPGRLQIVVQDDRGTPEGAAAGMRALQEAGAVAVVGPLDQAELAAAVRARTRPIPVVSPTSPLGAAGEPNVYTMGGVDLGAARALAQWAVGSGLRRVVLLHPRGEEPEQEAAAFQNAFRAAGGLVLGQFVYPRGATYFQNEMRSVAALLPDALVLPIPSEDVEIVAPQITFFGIDTLNIRILGTAGWTRAEVLSAVSPRHTDGVVAVTPDPFGDDGTEGIRALVQAYEELYRRTLRSSIPAIGYDAAVLLLAALGTGARSPAALASALERIESFPGATGQLGVGAGQVTRQYRVVCVQDRRLLPLGAGEGPILVDRRSLVAPGERPPAMEGPPLVVLCPGVPTPGPD